MMEELAPCPFCGSEANIFHRDGIEFTYSVECSNEEDCNGSVSSLENEEEAIKTWNTRVNPHAGYEAESEDDAREQAEENSEANWRPILCAQCAHEVELGEVYDTQVKRNDDE